jgi:glycosyltransferase involved in cell wall biosynthesis
MDEPLVSIIISNYNYECFLQDAVNSALDQSYANVEVIVVDDGSTDDSRKVIGSYGDRIIPVLKENGGQASAFNAGFLASSGEIVIFLDADDYLLPHAVEQVVAAWEPNTVKVHYRLEHVDARGNSLGGFDPPRGVRLDSGDVVPILLHRGYYITPVTSGNAFSRAVLDQILPIPEAEFRVGPDGYLVNMGPFYGEIGSIESVLGVYRMHSSSTSHHGLTDVDDDKLRRMVRGYLKERALIVRKAEGLGLKVSRKLSLRNFAHVQMRLASLRLNPREHPISSDRRLELAYWGLRALWGYSGLDWRRRFIFSVWFLWVGLLPLSLAKPAMVSQSRPRAVDLVFKSIRSFIRQPEPRGDGLRS